ncbi:elastin [Parastagonospora nodorum]|uniref:Elastin n=1 Tax=Phaeosphaeria nodorum (strain SN15 / ATCC MYA-4574 / FGSC 10173) TaxID=321614 RepID=A0A7U2NR77_PHANO|nr:elastin [Parastagonospora nodorum]QRD07472.1 elastin [Parastagonospora nodorum SN15]KAH3930503.1 elastin [Parastagonospora nodorum]KAH3981474.1 elastin [Parastagonospora nodorum]KAH4050984.1 elastin [Parastagonospora nodorum]
MSVKPPYDTADADPQLQSIFFTLPRELRDQIYHFLLLSTRRTFQSFPLNSTSGTQLSKWDVLQLQYRLPADFANTNPRNLPFSQSNSAPDWLFSCKAMMHEGVIQFSRNAEWLFDGHRSISDWTLQLPIDTSRTTRIEFKVQNLANYEEPRWGQGTDTYAELAQYAQRMRKVDIKWTTIRFVGHSYRFGPTNVYCNNQANNMMRNLVTIFDGIDAQRWEFGIQDPEPFRYWVLFEWVVEEAQKPGVGKLEILVKERTRKPVKIIKPEEDLANLLPPGWVCKRPPCECNECVQERAEGHEGGYGPRPDVEPRWSHYCGNKWSRILRTFRGRDYDW